MGNLGMVCFASIFNVEHIMIFGVPKIGYGFFYFCIISVVLCSNSQTCRWMNFLFQTFRY